MFAIAVAGNLLVLPLAVQAATYAYTDLDPGGFSGGSYAYGTSGDQQVGSIFGSAVLWSGTAGSVMGLDYSGFSPLQARGISDSQQVGYGLKSGINSHALLWRGTASTVLDLNPSGFTVSFASGTSGIQQVGHGSGPATANNYHALLWSGTANSVVDLHPSGFTESAGYAISGGQQVGAGYGPNHALLWSGTANSVVDLNPSGFTYSYAYAISGAQQAGEGRGPGTGNNDHALLWSGTANSVVDLNPSGFAVSYARGISGGQQVGYGTGPSIGYNYHALLWSGTANSFVDLHSFLSSDYSESYAQGIDANGNIVGYAHHRPTGFDHAILWKPAWRVTIETQLPKPSFGNYPTKQSGKDSLIVITHGWSNRIINPPVINPPDLSWIDRMSDSISQYLMNHGPNNWQVYGYKWLNNSWTVGAPEALYNARQEGLNLGSAIAVQGWGHVHLIGHSAGAELIQEASEWIKAVSPTTTVQCTFLDAYVGNDGAGYKNYGKGTDWSDSYFAREASGSVTEGCLSNAYNVDVTWLDPNKLSEGKFFSSETGVMEPCYITASSHGWPIDFYANTIAGTIYDGFGFPLSKEAGNWDFARNNYPTGNVPANALGVPDPTCHTDTTLTPPAWTTWKADFTTWPTIKSTEGSVDKWNGSVIMHPNSPVWLATVVNPTNPVNTVSFDAEFLSANGSDSLLSVYWDTNVVGTVDELMTRPGLQHYSLSFPNASANSTHVLGFRLDPYTNALSSIILTNVSLTQIGVSQPFSLSAITNRYNGLLVYQLAGEAGFNYGIQASSNFVNWTNIAILANSNGTVRFYDQDSTNYSQRFYRAVAPN